MPNEKQNGSRNIKWLKKNQGFITWYLLKGAELLGEIVFPNGKTLEENIYKHLRCPISHEAKLDSSIALTKLPMLGATNNGMNLSRL